MTAYTDERPPSLEYASPGLKNQGQTRHWMLVIGVTLAAAVLGADAFAEAAGATPLGAMRGDDYVVGIFVRIGCGIIIALLTFGLLRFASTRMGVVGEMLRRQDVSLSQRVAMVLIACGTLCILSALLTQILVTRFSATATQMMSSSGYNSSAEAIVVTTRPPLTAQLVTVLALVSGLALIGLGVWGSLTRGGRAGADASFVPPT